MIVNVEGQVDHTHKCSWSKIWPKSTLYNSTLQMRLVAISMFSFLIPESETSRNLHVLIPISEKYTNQTSQEPLHS